VPTEPMAMAVCTSRFGPVGAIRAVDSRRLAAERVSWL
jgi:hypothetical protein